MRRRVLLLVVGITLLLVLAFAVPLAILIRHNVYQDAIRNLQTTADDIAYALRGSAPTVKQLEQLLANVSNEKQASIVLPNGRTIGRAPDATVAHPPAPSFPGASGHDGGGDNPGDLARPGPPSTTTAWDGGQLVQLPVPARDGGVYIVRVYESNDDLHAGETAWWLLLGGASTGLLIVGIVAGEIFTRRIVRPLVRTAETAQQLASGDVTARAPTTGPAEVANVGRALNRLADRIDELIAEERETVADLSHRLRTPLTALRLDAEALRDPEESERVGAQVSQLERMLTAVIRAARRPQREGRMPSCDATAVVGERVAFWSALAEDQGRTGTVQLPERPVHVRASREDLAAAVDALLENVIAHTPEGTAYVVRLDAVPGGARLEISDEGGGLPEDAPVRGRSDRGSSGLGLDIARRCAEAGGGSMTLGTSPSGGAQVTLSLAAA